MRFALLLLLLWAPAARAADVLAAVRAQDWAAADSAAAASPDPLARKLVLYYRLLTPGAARSAEIAAFLSENPDWPGGPQLTRRLAESLLTDHDDRAVLEICRSRPPDAAPSLLRCADAAVTANASPEADARLAWRTGVTDPAAEAAFLRQFGRVLTQDDQRRRFDHLAWTDTGAPGGALARQAARLDPAARPGAEARLALMRDAPAAPALFARLPDAARADPGLVLDLARWYRRAGQDRDAAAIWTTYGAAAEAAAPPERQTMFWSERNRLVRHLLQFHDDTLAEAVAALPTAAKEARLDAEFLAGWIALRRLDQPEAAVGQFATLAGLSGSAITQGRAHYWLGRALVAAGKAEAGRDELRKAAAWPTTYYGQLAALALGGAELDTRLRAAGDPEWTHARALDFAGGELARAAAILVAWGEPGRARAFLNRLGQRAPDGVGIALAARYAAALGFPDQAVAAARRAGRDGIALPGIGWPEPVDPPGPLDPAVTLGLIRQESSFDADALSPAGARGLMQLMPATANQVARKLGETAPVPLTDAGLNMRLGTAYLRGLVDRFGALPPAVAAYNAGPSRVQDWLTANGDPAAGGIDAIDWIELIPFDETRNYVQRVVENIVIYRARHGIAAPHPVVVWTGGGT